jgi:hypothetical protein
VRWWVVPLAQVQPVMPPVEERWRVVAPPSPALPPSRSRQAVGVGFGFLKSGPGALYHGIIDIRFAIVSVIGANMRRKSCWDPPYTKYALYTLTPFFA